ncbi:MAG: T9SS type A sorting domain-containing protein [Flavobacteriia bacterium]|jgi:hypothetical protein
MKNILLVCTFFLSTQMLIAQTPKIYINLATHNEMLGESYDTNQNEFDSAVTVINQILNHMISIDGRWNFQTCSKFVLGALNWDQAFTNPNDVLERMYTSGKVEIDSRNKTESPQYNYNISDVYHLLDSCGVTSTHTVGGFLAYPYANEDWTQFRNVKFGAVYHQPWQAEIIWGGGSPNHVQDLNDYGVWKPKDGDTSTNVYTHDPTANLWLVGNGCAPVIHDTTNNVQWIINAMRENIKRIHDGTWPSDKFYNLSVMINVRDFDTPGFFTKVKTVLDSIDAYVANGDMEWAFITDKLTAFQNWSTINNIPYSQWSCEEATAGEEDLDLSEISIYPNPVLDELFIGNLAQNTSFEIVNSVGKIVSAGDLEHGKINQIDMKSLMSGIYFVRIKNNTFKVLKD